MLRQATNMLLNKTKWLLTILHWLPGFDINLFWTEDQTVTNPLRILTRRRPQSQERRLRGSLTLTSPFSSALFSPRTTEGSNLHGQRVSEDICVASRKCSWLGEAMTKFRNNPFRLQSSRVLVPHEYLHKSALSLCESCRLGDAQRYHHTTPNRLCSSEGQRLC